VVARRETSGTGKFAPHRSGEAPIYFYIIHTLNIKICRGFAALV
jgi:hypothetical protein